MKFAVASISLVALAGFASAQVVSNSDKSRFGGPVYTGEPALNVTASLVAAGGGDKAYFTATAFTSMLGQQSIANELIKLKRQYGETRVKQWFVVFDFAINDALKQSTAAGMTLPSSSLSGEELARAMVHAATDDHGTVWSELYLDKTVGHSVNTQVMLDIDQKFGVNDDKDFHRITNQALYDIGLKLGVDGVKRARLH